jgi:hypothetical protein
MHPSCAKVIEELLTGKHSKQAWFASLPNDRRRCHFCDKIFVGKSNQTSHFARHKEEFASLQEDLCEVSTIATRACRVRSEPLRDEHDLLHSVGSGPGKDAALAAVCQYVFAPTTSDDAAAAAADDDDDESVLLERPRKKLKLCVENERRTLLELAVWKGECLRQMPVISQGNAAAAMEWMRSGWKVEKEAQRSSNAMVIVSNAVLPFLDNGCIAVEASSENYSPSFRNHVLR